MEVTTEHIYLSMGAGERFKINRTSLSIFWVIAYGDYGLAMTLSSDQSFLIVSAKFGPLINLG